MPAEPSLRAVSVLRPTTAEADQDCVGRVERLSPRGYSLLAAERGVTLCLVIL